MPDLTKFGACDLIFARIVGELIVILPIPSERAKQAFELVLASAGILLAVFFACFGECYLLLLFHSLFGFVTYVYLPRARNIALPARIL